VIETRRPKSSSGRPRIAWGCAFASAGGICPAGPTWFCRNGKLFCSSTGASGCKRTVVPKTNLAFWVEKFDTNMRRDEANYARLAEMGWRVIVLWQCEIGSLDKAMIQLRRGFPSIGIAIGYHK
jgi:hypothetical protein